VLPSHQQQGAKAHAEQSPTYLALPISRVRVATERLAGIMQWLAFLGGLTRFLQSQLGSPA